MNTSASNNRLRIVGRSCKPADVVTAIDPLLQSCPRFSAQNLKGVIGNVSHILKHSCSMPRDDVRIRQSSATNLKRVGGSSCHRITIRMSAMLLFFSSLHSVYLSLRFAIQYLARSPSHPTPNSELGKA